MLVGEPFQILRVTGSKLQLRMQTYTSVVTSVFHGDVLPELLRGSFLGGRNPHVFAAPLHVELLLA